MKYTWFRTALEEGKLHVIYICSTSIPAQTAVTPDPPQASRPPRHQNAGWRKPMFGIPCRCRENAYQNLGIVARVLRHQSAGRIWWSCPAWPSLRTDGTFLLRASPCRLIECNTSLSALVREGRPIFVMCTQQCSAHIRSGRRDRYNARAGCLACSECALNIFTTTQSIRVVECRYVRFVVFICRLV